MKKLLSFAQICPNWAHGIKEFFKQHDSLPKTIIGFRDKKRHQLYKYACCIVGEAYKFNDNYSEFISDNHCTDCINFAINFDYEPMDQYEFEKMKNKFVKHWNRKHQK